LPPVSVFGQIDFFGKIFSREISGLATAQISSTHEDLRFLRFHERDPSSS